MSATAAAPAADPMVGARGFFSRMKAAIKRATRSTMNWFRRAGQWIARNTKRAAIGTGRATVRGTGYVGRFLFSTIGLVLGGAQIILSVALGILLGVLAFAGVLVMGIYSVVAWPLNKVMTLNRKYAYTTSLWLSQPKEVREDLPLNVFRASRMADEQQVRDIRAEQWAERIDGWVAGVEESAENIQDKDAVADQYGVPEYGVTEDGRTYRKRPADPTQAPNRFGLTQEEMESDKEISPLATDVVDTILGSPEVKASGHPEDFTQFDAFGPTEVLLEAFQVLSEDSNTKKSKAHFIGRHAALANYLADPAVFNPEDKRTLSLLLQQYRGQQSSYPQRYVREGYNAQAEILKALVPVA